MQNIKPKCSTIGRGFSHFHFLAAGLYLIVFASVYLRKRKQQIYTQQTYLVSNTTNGISIYSRY